MNDTEDFKYITLRVKALTQIINLFKDHGLQDSINQKLDEIFYSILIDDFLKIKKRLSDDQSFFDNISVQAKELFWGDWHWVKEGQELMLHVSNSPFSLNASKGAPEIPFVGPVLGVFRAVCFVVLGCEKCNVSFEHQDGALVLKFLW